MTLFDRSPPPRQESHNLTIVRTPARGKIAGLSLAEHLTGTWLHFYGRSTPCTRKADCPICARTNEPRWTGYLPIWNPATNETTLLELPTSAAETIEKYIRNMGNLKHKKVTVTRPKGKANSPVNVRIETYDIPTLNFPPEPNVELALCAIWRLDPDDLDGSLRERMVDIQRYHEQQAEENGHQSPNNL